MDLIKLNNYTPPSPTQYDVDYSDVNGENSNLEDGTTYIEQIRGDVPEIKVGWTNLTQAEVTAITNELADATVNVQYFYGTIRSATMTKSNRALKLKFVDGDGDTYWNLSFTLKG